MTNCALQPWHLLVTILAGVTNQEQQRGIEYLRTYYFTFRVGRLTGRQPPTGVGDLSVVNRDGVFSFVVVLLVRFLVDFLLVRSEFDICGINDDGPFGQIVD